MPNSTLLIVDDDTATRQLISTFLRANGFETLEAWSVAGARRLLIARKFDAMVLDVELDDGEGYEILRDPSARDVATLVISARQQVIDRVVSLELGADDYVTKPIDLRELLLRIRRTLHRSRMATPELKPEVSIDKLGRVRLDVADRVISRDGRAICSLSSREFKLLRLFLAYDQTVLDRDRIARDALEWRSASDSRAVDMLVSKLRKKVSLAGGENAIKNIRGEGYMFDASKIA